MQITLYMGGSLMNAEIAARTFADYMVFFKKLKKKQN